MTIFAKRAAEIWRDHVTVGVPASGVHQPVKSDVRQWCLEAEALVDGTAGGGSLLYTTRALLYANLVPDADARAIVYADATTAYNGTYAKSGASGAGSWTRVGEVPVAVLNSAIATETAAQAAIATAQATAAQGSAATATTQATAASGSAASAANAAASLALIAGVTSTWATKAALNAGAAGIAANAFALVLVDETRANRATIYQKVSGVMTFVRYAEARGVEFDATLFGATGDGTTNDQPAIQAALDAAAALGGGIVYLPPGTYLCNANLAVGSSVHLTGAGKASVIRNPAGALASKTISGVAVFASIALVGVSGAKVSRLSLDHRTLGCTSNGIQIGAHGAAVRSTDCVVEECTITGTNHHKYLIYLAGAHDRSIVQNNTIDGHTAAPTLDLAGIEVFGGVDCIVEGNVIDRCRYGIVVPAQTAFAASPVANVRVAGNRLAGCYFGIFGSVESGVGYDGVMIVDNFVADSANSDIAVAVGAAAIAAGFVIDRNVVDTSLSPAGAINIYADAAAGDTDVVVRSNSVRTTSVTCVAVAVSGGSMVEISDNKLSGTPYSGVQIDGSARPRVAGNRITGARSVAVAIGTNAACTLAEVSGNSVSGWGQAGATNAIVFGATTTGIASGNHFEHATPVQPIYSAAPANVRVAGNTVSWQADATVAAGTNAALDAKGQRTLRVVGAAGAFGLAGIVPQGDGDEILLINLTGQDMTLYNESGAVAAAHRIETQTAAGVHPATTGRGSAHLVYTGPAQRWQLVAMTA